MKAGAGSKELYLPGETKDTLTSMGLTVFIPPDAQVFYAKGTMLRYHRMFQKVFVHPVKNNGETVIHEIR